MNDKIFDFAEEQHKILMNTFLNKGFGFLDFPEATMYITLNSVVATKLLSQGVLDPTEKQLQDESINACEDIIKFFVGYKTRLICEEG